VFHRRNNRQLGQTGKPKAAKTILTQLRPGNKTGFGLRVFFSEVSNNLTKRMFRCRSAALISIIQIFVNLLFFVISLSAASLKIKSYSSPWEFGPWHSLIETPVEGAWQNSKVSRSAMPQWLRGLSPFPPLASNPPQHSPQSNQTVPNYSNTFSK